MSQADLLDQDPVFQLKGSMLAITVLELVHTDLVLLDSQLQAKVAQAPNFFSNIPLVLALDKLPDGSELNLAELQAVCKRHGLRIMAIRSDRETHIALANSQDLAVLPPSGAREKLIEPAESAAARRQAEKPKEPEEPPVKPTRVITSPVRGGMQVYAEGGDLVVLAPVSAGAELLADGNIHVYGPMRGRALAGVKGNLKARIFCQQMGAEMLSIAGKYKVAEDLRRDPAWGDAVHVSLSGDVLKITRL